MTAVRYPNVLMILSARVVLPDPVLPTNRTRSSALILKLRDIPLGELDNGEGAGLSAIVTRYQPREYDHSQGLQGLD